MNAPTLRKSRFSPSFVADTGFNISSATISQPPSLQLVSDDSLPIDQQLANAFNANNAVMAYVIGITGTTLPVLPKSPAWYTQFQTAFSDIQIHANSWYTIATNLVSIPNSIAAYGLAFNASMTTINSYIGILQIDPTNSAAIRGLVQQFSSMITQLSTYSKVAVDFRASIETFDANLAADAATMSQAVKDSLNTQGADRVKIQGLLDDINSLNSQIKTWQTVMTAAGIGAGVGFFAGAVIAIFSFGFGLAFGVLSAAAGIATMIAADAKIKSLSNKIKVDQAEMDVLNQQISALAALNVQLEGLIVESQAAGEQVELVLQVWSELQAELERVIVDLERCEGDVSPLRLDRLQADLNTANRDWSLLVSLCNKIASVKYNQATPVSQQLPTA